MYTSRAVSLGELSEQADSSNLSSRTKQHETHPTHPLPFYIYITSTAAPGQERPMQLRQQKRFAEEIDSSCSTVTIFTRLLR